MDIDVVAFRPEREGESVEGVLVARDITTSDYTTDEIPVLTLKQADGVYRGVRGYHQVLRNELEKVDPQIGDTVAIKYLGKLPNKAKTGSYHGYKVRVAHGEVAPSQAAAMVDDEPPF